MPGTRDEVKKILSVEVRYGEAINRLGQLRVQIDAVKEAEKLLKEQFADGRVSQSKYASQMAALDQQLKVLKDDHRILSKEVQNNIKIERQQEGSLVSLRTKLSNLTKEFDNLGRAARNGAQGTALMKQINAVTKEIKDAESATQRFYRNVGNYRDALRGINELSVGFNTLGGIITGIIGGLGFKAFTTNMMETARSFEDSIARVHAVSNAFAGDMEELRSKARELGSTTRYTASEVADGMEILARRGMAVKDIMQAINPTLQLAQANAVSIADAAEFSGRVMNSFALDVNSLGRVNDILSSACSHSATNLTQLGEAMKTAAPVAHAAGLSLEECTAAVGALANIGMTGSDAGTGVKQLITALAKADTTKKGMEILQKYGVAVDEVRLRTEGLIPILKEMKAAGLGQSEADIATLVGKYAAPRMAALIESADNLSQLNNILQNSLGETERMFNQSLGNTTQAVTMLKSAWESFAIGVYDSTSEYIVSPINGITSVVRFLGENIATVAQFVTSLLAGITITPMVMKATDAMKRFRSAVADAKALEAQRIEAAAVAEKELTQIREREAAKQIELEALKQQREVATIETWELRKTNIVLQNQIARDRAAGHVSNSLVYEQAKVEKAYEESYARMMRRSKAYYNGVAELAQISSERQAAAVRAQTASAEATTLGFFGKLKVGIKGVIGAASGMMKMFAWTAVITGIIEVISGLKDIYDQHQRIEGVQEEMQQNIEKAQNTDTITKLQHIQRELVKINERQKKKNISEEESNKLEKEKQELIGVANGMLGTQHTTFNQINAALDKQIKKMRKLNKLQAIQNMYNESYKGLIEAGKKAGIDIIGKDPMEIFALLDKQWNKNMDGWDRAGSRIAGVFTESFADVFNDAEYWAEMFKYADKELSAKQKALALGEKDNPEVITPSDYKGHDPYSPKNKNKGEDKARAAWDKYQQMLVKYQNELDSTLADTTQNSLDYQISKVQAAYQKVIRETDKYLTENEAERNKAYEEMFKNLGVSDADKAKYRKILEDTMKDVREAAYARMQKAERDLIEKFAQQQYAVELEMWNNRIALAKEKSKEWYEATMGAENNKLVSGTTALGQRYLNGELGRSKDGKTPTWTSYDKYNEERSKISNSDATEQQKQERIKILDSEYQAEARYYTLLEQLAAQHELTMSQIKMQRLSNDHDIEMRYLEAELQAVQTKYDEMTNLRMDAFYDMEYATEDFWNKIAQAGGAALADELRGEQARIDLRRKQLNEERAEKQKANLWSIEDQTQYVAEMKGLDADQAANHAKAIEAMNKAEEARFEAASNVFGGLIKLTEQLGEENEEFAKLSKVLALAQIAIDTGKAIATGTASAMSLPYPANIAAEASTIATVLANIATAISTVKSAKFATGAVNIRGAGTGTSDSIPAMISNGESVINAKATQMFPELLTVMNAIGNGVALPRNNMVVTSSRDNQYQGMTDSFRQAAQEIKPVVSVVDINRGTQSVNVIENIDTF